uniref:Uncharacterized protein n=1 Tax=Euplotes harpa TaxID=151035 RepID=A0A7S3JEM8_9SPIT|mmetsp:Transcript_33139/g.38067  ORF Transcript_33139/g.38067 Transcript_33139/m.38067 type:complete len:108 (+) Transcript_33139:96-419(+)
MLTSIAHTRLQQINSPQSNSSQSLIPKYKESTIRAFKCLQQKPTPPPYLSEKQASRKSLISAIIKVKPEDVQIDRRLPLLSNLELKQKLEEVKLLKQIQLQKLHYNR